MLSHSFPCQQSLNSRGISKSKSCTLADGIHNYYICTNFMCRANLLTSCLSITFLLKQHDYSTHLIVPKMDWLNLASSQILCKNVTHSLHALISSTVLQLSDQILVWFITFIVKNRWLYSQIWCIPSVAFPTMITLYWWSCGNT